MFSLSYFQSHLMLAIHREFLLHGHHGVKPSGDLSKKSKQNRNKRILFKLNQFTGKYVYKQASKNGV